MEILLTHFNLRISLVPRPCGRREKWPGIHCLRMHKKNMISWGIVYHRLRTVNLYRIAPKHVRLANMARTLIKRSSSLFVVLEREISR